MRLACLQAVRDAGLSKSHRITDNVFAAVCCSIDPQKPQTQAKPACLPPEDGRFERRTPLTHQIEGGARFRG